MFPNKEDDFWNLKVYSSFNEVIWCVLLELCVLYRDKWSFSWLCVCKSFSPIKTRLSPTFPLNFLSSPSELRAMPLVNIMPGGNFGHQMSLESFVTLALVSVPTCVSVCIRAPQGWLRHILQDSAAFRSTMPLRLLGCGAPGTSLIIHLTCVYLCWTRLSGRGSWEGKGDTILPAHVRGARKSRGTVGIVEMCISVYVHARLGDRGGNNAEMLTGVMVWLTHKHTI